MVGRYVVRHRRYIGLRTSVRWLQPDNELLGVRLLESGGIGFDCYRTSCCHVTDGVAAAEDEGRRNDRARRRTANGGCGFQVECRARPTGCPAGPSAAFGSQSRASTCQALQWQAYPIATMRQAVVLASVTVEGVSIAAPGEAVSTEVCGFFFRNADYVRGRDAENRMADCFGNDRPGWFALGGDSFVNGRLRHDRMTELMPLNWWHVADAAIPDLRQTGYVRAARTHETIFMPLFTGKLSKFETVPAGRASIDRIRGFWQMSAVRASWKVRTTRAAPDSSIGFPMVPRLAVSRGPGDEFWRAHYVGIADHIVRHERDVTFARCLLDFVVQVHLARFGIREIKLLECFADSHVIAICDDVVIRANAPDTIIARPAAELEAVVMRRNLLHVDVIHSGARPAAHIRF